MSNPETQILNVALYRFRGYQSNDVEEVTSYIESDETQTRISEPVEVTFIIKEDAALRQVETIRAQMKEEQAKAALVQIDLQSQINDLLALPSLGTN